MNIFFLDMSPERAARYHCDKHVIKMILESAQLLCTAHRVLDGFQDGKRWAHPDASMDEILYKATHINHPCAIWVRESKQNYSWVYELMMELNKEFVRRYNKSEPHATIRKAAGILLAPPKNLVKVDFTCPPKCMPEEVQLDDVVSSYRNYYSKCKMDIAKWTNTNTPEWIHG